MAVGAALAALFWPRSAPQGLPRPGGELVDADGARLPLAGELGPVTLIHFWATWCPPCVTEIPTLVEFAASDQAAGVTFLMVAVSDDPRRAAEFLGAARLPLRFDPDWDVAHRFDTRQLPETHIVVDGRVVDSFIGAFDWRERAVRARVQKWTARPPAAMP